MRHPTRGHRYARTARNRDRRCSWLVFVDATGVGAAVAEALRLRGHRVRTVEHQPVDELTEVDGEYVMNTGCPDQMGYLITHVSC